MNHDADHPNMEMRSARSTLCFKAPGKLVGRHNYEATACVVSLHYLNWKIDILSLGVVGVLTLSVLAP